MLLSLAYIYCIVSLIAGQELMLETETSETNLTNEARIVGGSEAFEGQWPWQVAISRRRTFQTNYYFICGGSLIGNNWVLSAAHCFTETNIAQLLLQFGVHDITNPSEHTERRYTNSYQNHEDYDSSSYHADISLVRFDESLVFNYYIQAIGLPSITTTTTSGQTCVVSGFGETQGTGSSLSVLRYAEVDIISLATCNQWYADVSVTVTDDHICAGYEAGGVDTCQGDSGGPLVCIVSSSSLYVVQGITSFGVGCAIARRPGAYTSVQSYIDWIVQITNLPTGTGIPLIPNSAVPTHQTEIYFMLILTQHLVCYFFNWQ